MTKNSPDLVALLADESFQRWITGAASEAEIEQWREWLNVAPSRQELLTAAKELWHAAQFQPAALPDVETELRRLQQRLKLPSPKTASIRRLDSQAPEFGPAAAGFSWKHLTALAAAAVLLLAILWRAGFLSWPNKGATMQTVSTDYGQRQRLALPDGTTIVLNAHSTLRYPSDWSGASVRRVELRGEAYFDVAATALPNSAAQQPFVVQTGGGEIRVLGTKFVVYERGQGTRVVVEEGSVMVTTREAKATPALLAAGQSVAFQKGDSGLTPLDTNLGFHTTWWREDWQLDGTPFAEVIRRLEETYGIRVEVQAENVLQRRLSGAVENRDLEVITEALAKALRLEVRRNGNVVTFSRPLEEKK